MNRTAARLLLVAVLAASGVLPVSAKEPHRVYPGAFKSGSMFVCDTAEQMSQIVTAHRTEGFRSAQETARIVAAQPGVGGRACGMVEGVWVFVSAVWTGEIDGDPAVLAEVALLTADNLGQPPAFYAVLGNTVVVSKDEAQGRES